MSKDLSHLQIEGCGGKDGGGSSTPSEDTDSLRSTQIADVTDLISEGQCGGPVNGLKSVFLDGVPIQNADGSYNFIGVDWAWTPGTQGQAALPGLGGTENTQPVGVQVLAATPIVRTITNAAIDTVRVTIGIPQLSSQDMKTGDLHGSSVEWAIDVQSKGGGYVQRYRRTVSGKNMSLYTKSVSVALNGGAPYDIRVRRISPDSTTSTVVNAFSWIALSEIQSIKQRYPHSAVSRIRVDAQQFSRIPVRSFDWKGRYLQVPSNYDPVTRAYTGTWDGTFKLAWSDNPAWALYLIITHRRFGLGEYVDPAINNKWALYQIGRYCDGLVPDGKGGMEPRFTCNLVLSTRAEAYQVLRDLSALFRGMVYWGNGAVEYAQDAPAEAELLYTPANVVDGVFTYQDSSEKTQHSVFIAYWTDLSQQGKSVPEVYAPDDLIARYGVREMSMQLIGCTSRGQAARMCRWARYTEQHEGTVVAFRVGSDGQIASPGKVFKIADPSEQGERLGGRIVSATRDTIKLDASVALQVGETYTITVIQARPNDAAEVAAAGVPVDAQLRTITETRSVTTPSGVTTDELSVSPSFSVAPQAQTIWVLQSNGIQATYWRCLGVKEATGKNQFEISAISHNPSKYDAIELGLTLDEPVVSRLQVTVLPPTDVAVIETVYDAVGVNLSRLTVSWVPSAQGLRHQVSWRQDSGWWQRLPKTAEQTVDIPGLVPGVYEVTVSSTNALGAASPSVLRSITLQGGPSGIRALRLSATSLVFRVATDGSTQPGHIDLALDQGALVGQVAWQTSAGMTLTGSGAARSLAAADMTVDSGTVSVLLTERGRTYSDHVTVLRLRDGLPGQPGLRGQPGQPGNPGFNGADAISASLTLDAIVLPASGDGSVASYAGAQSSLVVFKGVGIDTDNWTFTETHTSGLTPVLTTNRVVIQGMAQGTDIAYVDVTATRAGHASITKRITVSKLKTGPKGQDGDSGLRGTVTLAAVTTGTSWSDIAANQALVGQGYGTPVNLDFVTLYNSDAGFSEARFRSNGAWLPVQAYIHGNMVLDGTLAARSLVIQGGVGGSIWLDPNVQDSSVWKWSGLGGGLPTFKTVTDGEVGNHVLAGGAGGASADGWPMVPISSSKRYRVSALVRSQGGADGEISIRCVWSDTARGTRAQIINASTDHLAPGDVWSRYSFELTPPTAARFLSPRIVLNLGGTVGEQQCQDIRIEEMVDSSLVVQGGLSADRINVENLSALSADMGVITAGRLEADVVFAGKVSAGSIDVQKLAGVTQIYSTPGTYWFTTTAEFTTLQFTLNGAGGGGGGGRTVTAGGPGPGTYKGGDGGRGGKTIAVFSNVPAGTLMQIVVGRGGNGAAALKQNGVAGDASSVAGGVVNLAAGGGGGGQGSTGNIGNGATGAAGTGGGSGANGTGALGGTGGKGNAGGKKGDDGSVVLEAFNANGVILRSEWAGLIQHLNQRFTTYSWP